MFNNTQHYPWCCHWIWLTERLKLNIVALIMFPNITEKNKQWTYVGWGKWNKPCVFFPFYFPCKFLLCNIRTWLILVVSRGYQDQSIIGKSFKFTTTGLYILSDGKDSGEPRVWFLYSTSQLCTTVWNICFSCTNSCNLISRYLFMQQVTKRF